MILSLRAYLLCVFAGIVLGVGLIVTHTAPGLKPVYTAADPHSRDAIRQTDVQQLADALAAYKHDNGKLPITIGSTPTQICSNAGANCQTKQFVDLSFLTSMNYLEAIPTDPGPRPLWGSGYFVRQLSDGRLDVTAPSAERGQIEATK